jgi:iron complex outermembrane receptor protein
VYIPGRQVSNSGLRPEVARTWTAGVVLTPRFVPGLQVSFDWYDIKLKQAINYVDAQQLAELCVDQPTINNQFCALLHRTSGTGVIDDFTQQPQNVADFRTAGLDVNLSYRFAVKKVGAFELKVIGSYVNKLSTIGTPGAEPTDELGQSRYYSPKYQIYASATYATGPFTFNYNMSWWDKTLRYTKDQLAGDPNYVAPEYKYFKPRAVHNIYASVDVQKNFQFYGGISNLFNQKPDLGSILYPTEDIGTSFYAGARVKF